MLSGNKLSLFTALMACSVGVAQAAPKSKHVDSQFSIGPYFVADSAYDGSELLINMASMRQPASILKHRNKLQQEAKQQDVNLPAYPRFKFSGLLQGLYANTWQTNGALASKLQISGTELNTLLQANSWISAYSAVTFDLNKVGNYKLELTRAFVVLGNLSVIPFYFTAGKNYVPFGRYSSFMVSSPPTLLLERTKANMAAIGFAQTSKTAAMQKSNAITTQFNFYF